MESLCLGMADGQIHGADIFRSRLGALRRHSGHANEIPLPREDIYFYIAKGVVSIERDSLQLGSGKFISAVRGWQW